MKGTICDKCGIMPPPEKLLKIESEKQIYYFCTTCLKQAQTLLKMKLYLNKNDRKLLKNINKFLKDGKSN